MKRIGIGALTLLCCFSLCGCNLTVMERQTFALCMSVDLEKDGGLTLSVQTPMNGSGTSSAATPEYTVFSATGESFAAALALLAASTPCALNFCQLKLCVVGYELAAGQPLRELITQLAHLPTMRPSAMVMIALGSGEEILKSQKPDFGMRMSTHLNIYMDRLANLELSPSVTIMECLRELEGGRIDALLPIGAVNAKVKEKNTPQSQGSGGEEKKQQEAATVFSGGEPWSESLLEEGLIAGTLPRTGDDPVEYLGSAAVGQDWVTGLLTAEETQTLLRVKKEAQLSVAMAGESTQLQVWLPQSRGETLNLPLEEIQRILCKLQAMDCDALGFGEAFAAMSATNGDWRGMNSRDRYRTGQFYVNRR